MSRLVRTLGRATLLAIILSFAALARAETPDLAPHARQLLAAGRAAECYEWLRESGVESVRDPLVHYLFAYAAFRSLQLADVPAYAESAARGRRERPYPAWPSASQLSSSARRALSRVPAGGWVRTEEDALYRVHASAGAPLLARVLERGGGAHEAAALFAFGKADGPRNLPTLSVYLFRDAGETRGFLECLGTGSRPLGGAMTIGLGVMMWGDPPPHRAEATLAHETLHALQEMVGLRGGPRWTLEGAAQLAEEACDPNIGIQHRRAALDLLDRHPSALDEALEATDPASYDLYPAYFLLADALYEPWTIGQLSRRLNGPERSSLEEALAAVSLRRADLLQLARVRVGSRPWEAARDLLALERLGREPTLDEWRTIFRRYPEERWLAFRTALAARDAGALEEARGLALALEAQGYLGSAEGTLAELLRSLGPP